jgi:hypothetical protein
MAPLPTADVARSVSCPNPSCASEHLLSYIEETASISVLDQLAFLLSDIQSLHELNALRHPAVEHWERSPEQDVVGVRAGAVLRLDELRTWAKELLAAHKLPSGS